LRANLQRFVDAKELMRVIVAHEKVATGPAAREALQAAIGYL
jgi:hypothetical protein